MKISDIRFRMQPDESGNIMLVAGLYETSEITEMMFDLTFPEAVEIANNYGKGSEIATLYGTVALTYLEKGLLEGHNISIALRLEED